MKKQTAKQQRWRIRSQILWRLKGIIYNLPTTPDVLTQLEREKITKAFSLIEEVINDSTKSSIELGFNAKPRCNNCGKPLSFKGCTNRKCYKSKFQNSSEKEK